MVLSQQQEENLSPPAPKARAARLVNAGLGIWLFVSTFLWPHTRAQSFNVAVTGVLIALIALSAWSVGPHPRVRLVNAALGVWLLVSIGAFPTSTPATKINSAAVGILVIAVALIAPKPAGSRVRTA